MKDFVDHFKDMTGGSSEQQCSNWVDHWAWKNGYRIDRAGGIVPERRWVKDGEISLIIRINEVNQSGALPVTEEQLINWINGISHWL